MKIDEVKYKEAKLRGIAFPCLRCYKKEAVEARTMNLKHEDPSHDWSCKDCQKKERLGNVLAVVLIVGTYILVLKSF